MIWDYWVHTISNNNPLPPTSPPPWLLLPQYPPSNTPPSSHTPNSSSSHTHHTHRTRSSSSSPSPPGTHSSPAPSTSRGRWARAARTVLWGRCPSLWAPPPWRWDRRRGRRGCRGRRQCRWRSWSWWGSWRWRWRGGLWKSWRCWGRWRSGGGARFWRGRWGGRCLGVDALGWGFGLEGGMGRLCACWTGTHLRARRTMLRRSILAGWAKGGRGRRREGLRVKRRPAGNSTG